MRELASKKLLGLLIPISLIISLAVASPSSAVADGTYPCGGGGTYTIASNIVTSSSSCAGSAVIPEGVTSVSNSAFENATSLTSLTLPNSLTTIGNYAFKNTSSLTTINFGTGLRTIGLVAFEGATALTSLTLPNSLTTIGNYAFRNTSSLTTINFGTGLRTIGAVAFENATALTSLTLPNSLTTIENYAFKNTSSLTTINFGTGLTTIGAVAFENATSLAGIYFFGNKPTTEGANIFGNVRATNILYKQGTTGWVSAGSFGGLSTYPGIEITLNNNGATGGNTGNSALVQVGGSADSIPQPTKSGLQFTGWFDTSSLLNGKRVTTIDTNNPGTLEAGFIPPELALVLGIN